LEPLNQTIGQAATIVNAIQRGEDVSQAAGDFALMVGANLAGQGYLQTLSTFLQGLHDPSTYGTRVLNSMASSTVPALARIGAHVLDPTVRQTNTPLEAMQADIPGLSQNLPPRLTAFGEPQNRLTSSASPIGVSQAVNDPVDTELTRYGVEPGFTGKVFKGIDLTRQEQAEYQRLSGQWVKQQLDKLINDPRYAGLTDAQKAHILQLRITQAKGQAQRMYFQQLYQQQGRDALIQRVMAKRRQRLPQAG
jgi:hypothetical protein